MSKLETNTIDTVSGTTTLQVGSTNTSTITLGVSGDTINVPSGVTINNNGTQTGFGGVNTPYFYAYKSSSQTGLTNDADTKYQADTEGFDSGGCYNNTGSTVTLNGISTPSYSFAPNVAGKYVLFGSLLLGAAQQNDGREGALRFFKNGSGLNYIESTGNYTSYSFKKFRITSEIIVDANGTSDYFHITGRVVFNTNGQIQSGDEASYFGAYKLIE